jgi:transcription elongation GreA/GreB family factor
VGAGNFHSQAMTKRELLDRIVARLEAELAALTRAALATHAEATDEENKAEDKYDTRGLEASYLAHGQSKAADEVAQALAQFQALAPRDFARNEPIGLGALVTLENIGCYFFGPRAGGTEVKDDDGHTVLVITPQSPLGRQLLGRKQGDLVAIELGSRRSSVGIASVV